jgi:hypothetical protein
MLASAVWIDVCHASNLLHPGYIRPTVGKEAGLSQNKKDIMGQIDVALQV